MPAISLEAAKAEKRRVAGEGADYYARTRKNRSETNQTTRESPTSEPADPVRVDHQSRRQTRLAHPSFDTERLPTPMVECGCGECSDAVDPLASEDEVWRDAMMAVEVCPTPRPMTVERASEAYLRYQRAVYNRAEWTSLGERTRNRHGVLMGAERDLLNQYGDDVTVVFLSLRLSPVEVLNGERRWVPPVQLDQRLHDSWQNVYGTLSYQLRDFDFEYVAVTTTTTTAATPHTHVQILVEDPEDEVSVEMARSMVDSHVSNTKGAYPEDHPVKDSQQDAAIVFHDPPRVDFNEDRDLRILKARDGEGFPMNTVTMQYMADQRPHWVLDNVYDGASDVDHDSVLVDGGAVAWASPHRWLKWSDGIDLGGESGT